MTLSPELQRDLDQLILQRDHYEYTGNEVDEKYLTGLIAPSAVGKSSLVNEILRLCKEQGIDAGEVGSRVTRPRRNDGSDPANYRTASEGITHELMIDQIKRGELLNWSLPPTGDIYGSDAQSFPAKFNFLPLMPDSLPMLQRAGFKALFAIYITAPVAEWKERLGERYNDPKFIGRVLEAISSLEFAQQNIQSLHIVNNKAAVINGEVRPVEAAQKIIDITLGRIATIENSPESIKNIDDMLAYAKSLLEEIRGSV